MLSEVMVTNRSSLIQPKYTGKDFLEKVFKSFQVDYLTMSEQVYLPKASVLMPKILKNTLIRITTWCFSQDRFKK